VTGRVMEVMRNSASGRIGSAPPGRVVPMASTCSSPPRLRASTRPGACPGADLLLHNVVEPLQPGGARSAWPGADVTVASSLARPPPARRPDKLPTDGRRRTHRAGARKAGRGRPSRRRGAGPRAEKSRATTWLRSASVPSV